MANYKGTKGKIIDSTYLFTTIQELYTKIKNLLSNKADKNHTHSEYISSQNCIVNPNTKGGAWVSGKYGAKILDLPTPSVKDGSRYDPIVRGCNVDGDYWNFGLGAANRVGFYGFNKEREENGLDWATEIDITTGELYTSKRIHGTIDQASNADTLDGYHHNNFAKAENKQSTNWDTILEGGMYRLDDITSMPGFVSEMGSWGQLLVIRGGGDTITQIYCNYNNNRIFTRSAYGIGGEIHWTNWEKINNNGNADTVDGYHADNFIKSNGDTMTGTLTIRSDAMNGAYNGLLVGDDCYIGDCNVAHTIGLMSTSNNSIASIRFGQGGGIFGYNGANFTSDRGIELYGSYHLETRHVDGSNTGGMDGCLYLNYNNPDKTIYFGNQGYYITNNGSYYSGNSANAIHSNSLNATGFTGECNFSYTQTESEFNGRSGWAHYLIGNHGTAYHYTIGLPYWDTPIYKRVWDGGHSGWQKFYTTETITKGTSAMAVGSSLADGNIYIQYE